MIYIVVAIDDHIEIGELYQAYFKFHPEYEYHFFSDPNEGIQFIKTHSIHISLLDIKLPNTNGFELAQEIHTINKDIINIMLSAYSTSEILLQALQTHIIYDFIVKPMKLSELTRVLTQACQKYSIEVSEKQELDVYKRYADAYTTFECDVEITKACKKAS